MILEKVLTIKTHVSFQLIDITDDIERFVAEANIKEGICLIYVPHATAALILNEFESNLLEDISTMIKQLFPINRNWKHNTIDNNAHAHLASAFLGTSKALPISKGKLIRGTWQNIIFVELDGPRSARRIIIKIVGE